MNLLDEISFVENKNGRMTEEQISELKKKANIWFDLLLVLGIFVVAGFIARFVYNSSFLIPMLVASGISVVWLLFRSPTLIKHYLLTLPDVRENHIGYATGKLAYHKGYVLQTDEVRLSLPGDKNGGLLAGSIYEACYLPRAKMALSARVKQRVSETQQAREFTLLYGQLLGFTETDTQANRNGEFTSDQKRVILKKGWWILLIILGYLGYVLSLILPMPIDPAFIVDSIIFSTLVCGVAAILPVVVFVSVRDAKNILALFEKRVEQKEGVLQVISRTEGSGKSRATRYYLGMGFDFELQIPERTYEVLIDGPYCRIYYTPRMKYLAGVEVLKLSGENPPNK
jgi:hypothetical protein